ncbi:PQQ-dependent sugar dehydrogenase [uncultured Jatrophihabitans sp.]|uniref:PQQ-dependent sugar dehydrogenase n=1 Tax=uncultured Jatrophihabitans sp. TaxID=1610747 RepID=UPI0035CAD219
MRRSRLGLLVAAAALLAGCTSARAAQTPTWAPSPDFGTAGEGPGIQLTPIIPQPGQSSSAQRPAPGGIGGGSSSGAAGQGDPDVVATHLTSPVGLAVLPDNTALVGERATGRIVRVQPTPGRPVPTVRTLTGLDTSGDGGLLDLALSPTYDQDGLIYAYITTKTDNRVVDFTLTGPVTPVLAGIPKGRTGNTGRIAFGADGRLYIGTGDAGDPRAATNPRSLAGKVLRVTDIGGAAPGNPRPGSAVWTSGHSEVDGLCTADGTAVFETQPGGAGSPAEVNALAAGASYDATSGAGRPPAATLPAPDTAPGGCAIQDGVLHVTTLDGRALLSARVGGGSAAPAVGAFSASLTGKYGRLRTVVAADDGALWLTTSNRDGKGNPVAADERVLRILPPQGGGSNPA